MRQKKLMIKMNFEQFYYQLLKNLPMLNNKY